MFVFDRYVLPRCLTAMCHRFVYIIMILSIRVTRRAVITAKLRWSRMNFDREAAMVPVDL